MSAAERSCGDAEIVQRSVAQMREPSARYFVKPDYKLTEVGLIPHDWAVRTIGQTFRLVNGCAFKPEDWKQSGTPIVRIQNLNDPSAPFNFSQGPVAERNRVEPGDLLFAWSGTIGSSFGARVWAGPSGVLNQHIFKVAIDEQQITLPFSLVVFARVEEDIAKQAHGFKASFVHVKKSDLVKVHLPVPPLAEQRAIAGTLSDVDALLAGLDRLIAKKRDLKQAAMQQLLTGQTRLPGFQGEWQMTQLGRIAKIQRGASPRPIEDPIWFNENSSVGWVRISDVTRSGMFLYGTTQRLSPLGVEHSRPVSSGSLIMSICATVGRPVITRIDVCIHDGFVVFDELNADQRFVYYVLKWLEPTWSKHGQTGSQMNLNTGLINGAEILLPLREEQTAIATVLSDMDAELAALEARRVKTHALKQGMMQELLTGRTRLV
jgi:type I restriction enzyme S subunit